MKDKRVKESQSGAMTIMEAVFVFPIMLIVILMMILVGEAYYQHARVEYEVSRAAVSGAARCENPMQEYLQKNGNTLPTNPSAADVIPYRYFLTASAKSIGTGIQSDLTKTINSMKPLAFRAMSPKNARVTVTPKMNILVSSLKVECEFDIELPIRMLFSKDRIKLHYSVGTVEPIGDPSEFVRNVSTAQDLFQRSEKGMGIYNDIKEKLSDTGITRFIN